MRKTVLERFEESYIPGPDSGCWLWISGKDKDGYGHFVIEKKIRMRAHRFSWILYQGEITNGLWVLHSCDTPSCVNPSHLWLGTPKENSNDRDRKGRFKSMIGNKARHRVLSEAKVSKIKIDLKKGESQNSIASKYGCAQSTICAINKRLIWSHIK